MATVVFDFDSTLVSCESLEVILAPLLSPEDKRRLAEITEAGMKGSLPFHESLAARLAIARPRRRDVEAFATQVGDYITPGMDLLIPSLHEHRHQVWIVSGGFREAVLPLAERLDVPRERVLAICPDWSEDGDFLGLSQDDPMIRHKWQGAQAWRSQWPDPVVAVGDGMTDYELRGVGIADVFVAFTEHVRREEVVAVADHQAADCAELRRLLEKLC